MKASWLSGPALYVPARRTVRHAPGGGRMAGHAPLAGLVVVVGVRLARFDRWAIPG
jgi:hypothetical protein